MASVTELAGRAEREAEELDVIVVGAGLSGIGAAYHLQHELPFKTYAILEGRERMGGTWDLFRYPGIRSDSDLHTYGYDFKPWVDEHSIASGPAILRYIEETARENGIDGRIRFGHRVERVEFSEEDSRWTVHAVRTEEGVERPVTLRCSWLICAAGYYRYEKGYEPELEGRERFHGKIVHPQHWPEDLDYAGKRVVVIGSGATAVTLVPAMARQAAHVTMLQRSPTYVISLPERDQIANLLKRLLPPRLAYSLTRRKNVWMQRTVYELSRRRPALVKRWLRSRLARQLPPGYDIDRHFTPSYDPWDQRLCAVPDGDMFEAISSGGASVVTDRIRELTENGILLESGEELPADIVVTATGLDLLALGGIEVSVGGRAVALPEKLVYKSAMLSDVPNMVFVFGYTNSSWTLKLDLVCEYVCRLIAFMDERGYASARAVNDDPAMPTRPFLDFGAGYVRRAVDRFPRQGTSGPWQVKMSYAADVAALRDAPLDDGALRFARAPRELAEAA